MRRVDICSSVAIIHWAGAPAETLMQEKTPGYPISVYVGKGCLIGGASAKGDDTTVSTALRELIEELTLVDSAFDSLEMGAVFGEGHSGHASAPRNLTITQEAQQRLKKVVANMQSFITPFGAFIQKVGKEVFDMKNPRNTWERWEGLCHVFSIPLPYEDWSILVELQGRYKNLSNEGKTIIVSLGNIIADKFHISWAQDQILQKFFLGHGLEAARGMPLMPYTSIEEVSWCDSYAEVLTQYDVAKRP